jgi:hypothetical protein
MRITPSPHGLDLNVAAPGYVRTPGLHMSDLYNSLFQELEPKRFQKGGKPDELRMELGLAFEELLEEGLKERLVKQGGGRPGEFTTAEGIIFSPDLLLFNGHTTVGEIKLTWLSSREVPRVVDNNFPPKFDKWLVQMKAYCYALETASARLYAFFVNGDYKPPKPELLCWDIEFTARELQENWALITNHGRHVGLLT